MVLSMSDREINRKVGEIFRKHHGKEPLTQISRTSQLSNENQCLSPLRSGLRYPGTIWFSGERKVYGKAVAEMVELEEEINRCNRGG